MAYKNIRIHPVLRLIYLFLRILVWVSVRVFYRRRLVLGREHLRFDGPAIVIANHPSTLMDVLNPAVEIRQEMYYLANYGLFRHPVSRWLLTRLYCIPVKRKEDVTDGEARNNNEAFEASYRHLEQNGVLFIAPEGTSWMNRFVRPLKSGTARIALGAEARNDWQLGVQIIPVGLSYSAPHLFRSEVVVHIGAPVNPADWADAWEKNTSRAASDLTRHLEAQLQNLSIHTGDETGENLLTQLEEVLQNEHPLPQQAAFERSQRLARTALDDTSLREQTEAYFHLLETAHLTDAGVCAAQRSATDWRWAGLALGFPLFAAGYLFWFLPCYLPWLLNKKMGLYIGYSSTVKIAAGIFVFPIVWWGWYRLALLAGAGSGLAWAGLATLTILGYFVETYQDWFRQAQARYRAKRLAQTSPDRWRDLQKHRAAVTRHPKTRGHAEN